MREGSTKQASDMMRKWTASVRVLNRSLISSNIGYQYDEGRFNYNLDFHRMLLNKGYLFMYAFSQFLNGLIVGTAGPLIPFLATDDHIPATNYYFVFIARSGGAVLGALIYKTLQCYGYVSAHHKVLGITSIMFFVTLLLFPFWHSLVGTGVLLSLYDGLNYCQNIAICCSLLIVPSQEKLFFWLSMSNGSFGLGSLMAPLLVDAFKTHAFSVQALLILPLIPIYLFVLDSPHKKQEERMSLREGSQNQSEEAKAQVSYMTTYLAAILGINFFLLHGIQNTNGGWLSSYAVQAHIANNQQAALFTTIFWLTYTVARFVSGFIDTTAGTKLKRLTELGVVSALICIVLSLLNFKLEATLLCAVFQGISVSGIYPLSLALSYDYGLHLTEEQISTIMIVMMVSEAIMVAPTGFLMKKISIEVFFFALLLFNLVLLANSRFIISLFKRSLPEPQEKSVKAEKGNYEDLVEMPS